MFRMRFGTRNLNDFVVDNVQNLGIQITQFKSKIKLSTGIGNIVFDCIIFNLRALNFQP